MRFFRRRSSLGFLALLAVAMQAVLAFAETHAHVHSQAVVDKLATRAVTYGACAPRALHPCAPSTPHDDRGNCPVCGAVNLATAAILDQPPAVLTPPARFPAPAPVRVIHAVGGDDSVHFQARAPPALLMS
jgi:uncharacterized paraquat-inducible protein A